MKTTNLFRALYFTCVSTLMIGCSEPSEVKDDEPAPTEQNQTEISTARKFVSFGDSIVPTYDSLKSTFKTGDILLFDGFDLTGIAILVLEKKLNIPLFTHVGVIFDLPGNSNMPAGLYFWQAAPQHGLDSNRFGNDYIKGVPSNGAQMISLDTLMHYLDTLHGLDSMIVGVRHLNNPLNAAQQQKLFKYAAEVCGRSFSAPPQTGMPLDFAAGEKGIQSGDETFFCSKLASQTYLEAHLIESVITNSVLPGHFGPNLPNEKTKINFLDNGFGNFITFSPK